MILTFRRDESKEDEDIRRFWGALVDGQETPLAVIEFTKSFQRFTNGVRYQITYDEGNITLLMNMGAIKKRVGSMLRKVGNVTRLEMELSEVIHEAA